MGSKVVNIGVGEWAVVGSSVVNSIVVTCSVDGPDVGSNVVSSAVVTRAVDG